MKYAFLATAVFLAGVPAFCEWNPAAAASYLDGRQKAWLDWPQAKRKDGGVCVSCHTGLTYMLARPAIRTTRQTPTSYETTLLDAVKKRLAGPGDTPAEPVFAALLLASEDGRIGTLSDDTRQAFDRLWSQQISTGPAKGAWNWINADLDPFEEPYSQFYGASLAALAVGSAPGGYQSNQKIQRNLEDLKAYLAMHRNEQPLHNRLALLWGSTKLAGLLTEKQQREIEAEVLAKQQADGGWKIESLGSWSAHAGAPTAEGSNAYATGFTAFVLKSAGASKQNQPVAHAIEWLEKHQDHEGFWDAASMNKRYEPGSMQSLFMRDVATGFAVLALGETR